MELLILFSSLLAGALAALLLQRRSAIETVAVAASLIMLGASGKVAYMVAAAGVYEPYGIFSVDALGAIVLSLIALVGCAATVYSVRYLREETEKGIIGFHRVKQYFILFLLFLAAMAFGVTASNPVFTWISIEATTLATAFLISFYDKPSSMEAAWKYLIINSVGLLLGFFGTLLFAAALHAAGEPGVMTWSALVRHAARMDPSIVKIAFVFVLIGYGTKVGLAPMHTWLPDAHSKAPVPVSALLSGVLLNVAFAAILRFKAVTDAAIGVGFSQHLLIAFGLLSVAISVFIIFGQKNYKRLLAYSSIENMGIIAFGFGLGGLGAFAAMLHMIYHSLIKSALFFSAGRIFLTYSSTKIANVRGALRAIPMTSVLFAVGFFAITGTPPFGIFLTKVLLFSVGVRAHLAVTVLLMALTAVLFVGFFTHVGHMLFGEKPLSIRAGEGSIWLVAPSLVLLAIAGYLSFFLPPVLLTLVTDAASRY